MPQKDDFGRYLQTVSLNKFAVKHVFKGIPGVYPAGYLNGLKDTLVEFFTNHRNIKFKMVLYCLMERISVKQIKVFKK